MKTKFSFMLAIFLLAFLNSCNSNEDENLQNKYISPIELANSLKTEAKQLKETIDKIDKSLKNFDKLFESQLEYLNCFKVNLENFEELIANSDQDILVLEAKFSVVKRGVDAFIEENKIFPEDLNITHENIQNIKAEDSLNQLEVFKKGKYKIVAGSINISKYNSKSIDFLKSINFIGKNLIINDNPNLSNLKGLENVSLIGGRLNIYENPSLSLLDGLEKLNSVRREVIIGSNPVLLNFDGLRNLSSIGTALIIGLNPALPNIDGLSKLTSVGGLLYIDSNATLSNLEGLRNLTLVSGNLYINNNPVLSSFCGLQPLLKDSDFKGDYHSVDKNGYNPTKQNIIDGNCKE